MKEKEERNEGQKKETKGKRREKVKNIEIRKKKRKKVEGWRAKRNKSLKEGNKEKRKKTNSVLMFSMLHAAPYTSTWLLHTRMSLFLFRT
jgi:hypothetical protein